MDFPNWLVAIILGLIEGLTEFIPVSSTGHLLIAEHWLPKQSDLFNVAIQSGAVLAVLPLFRHRLQTFRNWQVPENKTLLLQVTFAFLLTAIGGVVLKKLDYRLTENTRNVAWALIVGGLLFILLEAHFKGRVLSARITWISTLLVGIGQLLAACLPGSSRSGTTILGAMASGTQRATATEFSFLVGIPTLLAAGALKTLEAIRHGDPEDWSMLGLATCAAAASSFVTVKWLLRFVQTHSFSGFGLYRIVAGLFLLWVL